MWWWNMAKKRMITAPKAGKSSGGGPVELIFVKPKQLEDLQNNIDATARNAIKIAKPELDKYGQIFVQSAQREIQRDTGTTAGGLDWEVNDKGELRIKWNKPSNRPKELIQWLLYGTGIYGPRKRPIVPKRPGGVLKFRTKDGRWHSKKSVRGMPGNNFLKEAWDNTEGVRRTMAQRVGALIVRSIVDGRGKNGPAVPNRN